MMMMTPHDHLLFSGFPGGAVGLTEHPTNPIPYHSSVALPLEYKGRRIGKGYVIDLLIQNSLIVEIKSVDKLLPIHSAQLMTYMRLQSVLSGLLINFNVALLPHGIRRILR